MNKTINSAIIALTIAFGFIAMGEFIGAIVSVVIAGALITLSHLLGVQDIEVEEEQIEDASESVMDRVSEMRDDGN